MSHDASEALIEARGIYKSFWMGDAETKILRGIDLRIRRKSILAIIGASGAGKSTLLHILSSLDSPTSGSVTFEGKDLYRRKDEELSFLRNRAIGFVFQFHHLMAEFTALENVMMPLLIRGESEGKVRQESLDILARLGLEKRGHHRPTELSGGEQQRIAVARALVTKPRVLFADEPTGNLDHENGKNLMDLFFALHREREMALVLVTHNAEIASQFSEKIHLEDGRIT